MLPYIRRTRGWETYHGNWIVGNRKHRDITHSFGNAVRVWFWYMGVSPRIAFRNMKHWKDE